jgi:hypothetical protein
LKKDADEAALDCGILRSLANQTSSALLVINNPKNDKYMMYEKCAEAGTGGLGLAIEGPSEAVVSCKDNCDGSCSVEYLPTESGDYDISIKFADKHIPGSPFRVPVENPVRLVGCQIGKLRLCLCRFLLHDYQLKFELKIQSRAIRLLEYIYKDTFGSDGIRRGECNAE